MFQETVIVEMTNKGDDKTEKIDEELKLQENVINSIEEIVERTNKGDEETEQVEEELKLPHNKETTVC